jgi:hypothetical protein
MGNIMENTDYTGEDKPYTLNEEGLLALEEQVGAIPPSLRESYKVLEKYVSEKFIEIYGQYMTPEQREVFLSSRMIFVDREDLGPLLEYFEKANHVDREISPIDGVFYKGYSIGVPIGESGENTEGDATVLYSGRVTIHVVDEEFSVPVDIKFLMSEDTLSTKEALDAVYPRVNTTTQGSTFIHEKVHIMQDPRLPLPIREAAAYFYAREVFRVNNWRYSKVGNTDKLADLYEECISEIGEDLHRFMLGSMDDPEILEQLKAKFTNERIKEVSEYHEYEWDERTHNWIYWDTVSADEI